jgi:hypothetical protein
VTGPPNDGSRDRRVEPEGPDPVVAGSALAHGRRGPRRDVLTLLLPSELSARPRWLLPILEGASSWRSSSVTRAGSRSVHRAPGFSIALVTVLIAQSLWSTSRLIDELIVGGPHTDKPGPLLAAARIVWSRTTSRSRLLYWELDSGGARGTRRSRSAITRTRVPSTVNPDIAPAELATSLHRLPLPGVHERHGVQPDRRHAVGAVGQVGDGRPGLPSFLSRTAD